MKITTLFFNESTACLPNNNRRYIEFEHSLEATIWGMIHYKKWSKQYQHANQRVNKMGDLGGYHFSDVLEQYCGHAYDEINHYLRTKDKTGREMPRTCSHYNDHSRCVAAELAHFLTMTLCTAPTIPNNIIVYRYIDKHVFEDYMRSFATYDIVQEYGFMSTTMLVNHHGVNLEFKERPYILKIFVPKGMTGAYVDIVDDRLEQEILLPPNRQMQLVNGPYINQNGKTVIECILLPYNN